jgi:hypothetical protein
MPRKHKFGLLMFDAGDGDCPPIREHFNNWKAADKWVHETHCTGDCEDNGLMIIGWDGDYTAVRFCTPRTSG